MIMIIIIDGCCKYQYIQLQALKDSGLGRIRLHVHLTRIREATLWPELHIIIYYKFKDRLCGLVVRVLGYRSGGPGSIPGTTRKKTEVVGLERGPLSLVSTTGELLDRTVAAPV
jgi:hypothetical protein